MIGLEFLELHQLWKIFQSNITHKELLFINKRTVEAKDLENLCYELEKSSLSLRQSIENDEDSCDKSDLKTIYLNLLKEKEKVKLQINELSQKKANSDTLDESGKINYPIISIFTFWFSI